MTNLTNHPCAGKCSEYKGEQCKHCLITNNTETQNSFIEGGKVVFVDTEKSDQLMTITQVQKNGVLLDGNSNFALNHLIRNATPDEHKANKRLTGAAYFLGWDLAAGDDQHIENHISPMFKNISNDVHFHFSKAIKAKREVS